MKERRKGGTKRKERNENEYREAEKGNKEE